VHGRLTWGDVAASQNLRGGADEKAFVEWVIPM
jgi:hypothetical protein